MAKRRETEEQSNLGGEMVASDEREEILKVAGVIAMINNFSSNNNQLRSLLPAARNLLPHFVSHTATTIIF